MSVPERCPVCGEMHAHLIRQFEHNTDQPLLEVLANETPGWSPEDGACSRCMDQAQIEVQWQCFSGSGVPWEVNGFKILPTPLRLDADRQYTGKGVTLCVIDSGFYIHPDLTAPDNRILHIRDISTGKHDPSAFRHPAGNAWHGTMTSVVAAGNGHLSNGTYKSIAPATQLVLLKVTNDKGVITGENIAKAIHWAIANAKKYNIRIINLSVTDDASNSFMQNEVDQAVGRAVEKGLVVIAASGNDPRAPLKAPATAPHAITVGGLNDRNTLNPLTNTLYDSTYGLTIDAFQKPDIIAPAIWIAAPILPGTPEQREARALFDLTRTANEVLKAKLANVIQHTQLDISILESDAAAVRQHIGQRIAEAKYISPHYKHVDGTSFAAPIVCSVVAQILEANPDLDPATVREVLLTTARRLSGSRSERQGWGLISPAHAVQMAAGKPLSPGLGTMPVIDYQRMMIDFHLHHPEARKVVLTGDFLEWKKEGKQMQRNGDPHTWTTSVPFKGKGVFRYKFLVDDSTWISDPRNYFREPDGFNDFNSRLILS